MADTYKLIYFNAQGRAEVSRYLFALSGTEYTDERLDSAKWQALKPSTPFGQMPLLEYNGTLYCQSDAIARFLARKFGLYGSNELEGLLIDQVLGVLGDVFAEYVKVNYYLKGEEQEKGKEKLAAETVPKVVAFLEKQLGANHFLVGNKVSLADAAVYDFLGFKVPQLLSGWKPASKAVEDHLARFGDIEGIKKWVATRPN